MTRCEWIFQCSACASAVSCWPRSSAGAVTRALRSEIGWRAVESVDPGRIPPGPWLVWHEDAFTAPPGAEALARTDVCLHAFIAGIHTGLQFHPEVTREIVGHWVDTAQARATSRSVRLPTSPPGSPPTAAALGFRPRSCSTASWPGPVFHPGR